jgi:hypothetical protein
MIIVALENTKDGIKMFGTSEHESEEEFIENIRASIRNGDHVTATIIMDLTSLDHEIAKLPVIDPDA